MLSFFVHAVTLPFARACFLGGRARSWSRSDCLASSTWPSAMRGSRFIRRPRQSAHGSAATARLSSIGSISKTSRRVGGSRSRRNSIKTNEYLQAARANATRPTWRSPWRGSSPDAGNSKWSARNLQMGAPSGPFASAGTHKSSLVRTASASSAYHSIATGKRTLRQVRVAPLN